MKTACSSLEQDRKQVLDRALQLRPLGLQRLRILDCLGGNSSFAPGYFAPSPETNVFEAFTAHVSRLSQQWATETDSSVILLLAAARLLTGDPSAADVIVDRFPAKMFDLDHGSGICLLAPFHAMSAALPLPADLKDTTRWLAGSPEQAALRQWIVRNREALHWIEKDAAYRNERA
jgi:hypothetical protein